MALSMNGAEAIAETLHGLGVEHIFGIVGIPVIDVAEACIARQIRFVSFRNEQSAVYAASIYGYLTGRPGVCLVVGGPGVVHALAGVENANANRLPMLLLAGSADTDQRAQGAFQQLDQISLVKAAGAKFAEQPPSLEVLPRLMRQAYTVSFYGKPGTAYIDLPADLIQARSPGSPAAPAAGNSLVAASFSAVARPLAAPKAFGDSKQIGAAAALLKNAQFPLLILGKGCAYARAEAAVRHLQSTTNIAFLPTPMGKGVVGDSCKRNVSAARSAALRTADVVLVIGARLNWILHYGAPPRFRADAKFVHVDSVAEELHSADVGVWGDAGLVAWQLADALQGWQAPALPAAVVEKHEANEVRARRQEAPCPGQLDYHPVFKVIRDALSEHASPIVYVSEGANTMDISRTSFPIEEPRTRLDAGTNATMGVGMGYAIAAKLARPEATVVAIEGDSAFGFSAMELDTAVRAELPMVVFVMNNSGVYHGVDPAAYASNAQLPSTALGLQTKYHELAESLGGIGFEARTLDEVRSATTAALKANKVAVVNVILDPGKDKKLEFGWMKSKI